MKKLLPLLLFLLPCFVQAQVKVEKLNGQSMRDALADYRKQNNERMDTTNLTPPKSLYMQSPKPGVHRLPQDNMPCLVPDPTASVTIPNAWKGEVGVPFRSRTPRIPNLAKPLLLSPARPFPIKPETR